MEGNTADIPPVPEEPEIEEINLDEYLHRAHLCIEEGKYREAIRLLEVVTEVIPEHAEAWNNLGVANLLVGDLDRAELSFRSGLERDPDNPQIIKNLIQTLIQIDSKAEEGVNLLVHYLQMRPTDPDAIFMLGRCFQAGGDLEKAGTLYRRTLELDPDFLLVREVLREMESEHKETDDPA